MSAGVPAVPLGVDPLIAEAKRRARRRRFLVLAAAGLVAAGVLAGELTTSGSGGGTPGTVPWLPTRPNLGPANPPLAAACTASQLRATLALQGATGNLAGGIAIVNHSTQPCSLLGRPKLSFAGATSKWHEERWRGGFTSPFDPLAPPRSSLRGLTPGEHVSVELFWSNWCGRGSNSTGVAGQPPAAMIFTAPGGGTIRLQNSLHRGLFAPPCYDTSGSTLQATRFAPFVPQGPPSSALPLKASIVSGAPLVVKGQRLAEATLVGSAGQELDYTVVLTNTSRHVFHFGRTCPAYTEGFGVIPQAYVLNCRAVGAIAPRQSVRFAMRIRVPGDAGKYPTLGWTLAPHSYNAPQTLAVLELR